MAGPFLYLRNPIYLGVGLLLFSVAFYRQSPTFLLAALLFMPAIDNLSGVSRNRALWPASARGMSSTSVPCRDGSRGFVVGNRLSDNRSHS